jgi:hypothetical protein
MLKAYEFKITQRCIEIATIITFSWLLFALLHSIQDYVLTKYNLDKEDNLRERKIRTQLQFLRLILERADYIDYNSCCPAYVQRYA